MRTRVIRQGNDLKVMVINGFLSEHNYDITDWLTIVDRNFPNATVIHVDWDASNMNALAKNFLGMRAGLATGVGVTSLPTNVIYSIDKMRTRPSVIKSIFDEWSRALNNAKITGAELGCYIDSISSKYILMGHSLGARVIFNTLINTKSSDRVIGAFLFGGAVGAENSWANIVMKKKIKIFNCYSDNDVVLKSFYKIGTLFADSPIGLTPINQAYKSQIFNIDMSRIVSGHTQYKNYEVGNLIKTYTSTPR